MRIQWLKGLFGIAGLAVGLSGLSTLGVCETAPPQLLGKSLSVGWNESRVERMVGVTEWRNQNESFRMEMYYSPSTRRFGRFSSNLMRKPLELVGASTAHFQRRSMVFYYRGGKNTRTRQFVVNFDQTFSSCEATIISGKPNGAQYFLMKTSDADKMLEAKSITISAVSCSVRDGNVFAQ